MIAELKTKTRQAPGYSYVRPALGRYVHAKEFQSLGRAGMLPAALQRYPSADGLWAGV